MLNNEHNLGEFVFLERLCGFCSFSMRFVVMIDLLSTLTQPVTVAYVSYFILLHRLLILVILQVVYLLYLVIGD